MLFSSLWIIFFTTLNLLRGWGPTDLYERPPLWRKIAAHLTSKVGTGIIAGFFVWFMEGLGGLSPVAPPVHFAAPIIALGWYCWALRGWGDYWDFSTRPNQEVGFIDSLALKIFPPGEANDLFSMSLRGGVFAMPLFLALSYWWPWAWIGAVIIGGQGLIYWVQNVMLRGIYSVHRHGNNLAEGLMGALWGLVLGLIIA